MLGHEGQHSLLATLKEEKYAEALSVETVSSFRTLCDLLCIEVTLTELGS